MLLGCVPVGESVLQADVPQLVDRACLAETASPVGIGKEPMSDQDRHLHKASPHLGYLVSWPCREREAR